MKKFKSFINVQNPNKTDLVEILWADAASRSGWIQFSEIPSLEVMKVRSVGFVVSQSAYSITISNSIGESGCVGDPISIPLGMIVKIRKINS